MHTSHTSRTRRGRIVKVSVDPAANEPLYRQIYSSLRTDIRDGLLPAGARLPSTRHLASDIDVARSTVVQAYEQLRAEGYIEGILGAGTRVCDTVPDRVVSPPTGRDALAAGDGFEARFSNRARATIDSPRRLLSTLGRPPRAFRLGVPAVDIFPVETWGRLLAKRWARTSSRQLAYSGPSGYMPLREAIAEYLRGARGVRCTASQILVVSGSQQALDLCARVLLDPGDEVWLEDPGYHGARGAFVAAGAQIVCVPVDEEGIRVEDGRAAAPNACAAFITPSRQLPLGVAMSAARRRELLAWAREANAWVIEDDYDSEFRFASRPLPALQGSDDVGCVIYTGTFSKVMFPSMRLGYLVVPEPLIDAFEAMRHFADCQSAYLEQAVMADFIVDGHFERHIRRMRTIYRERQDVLVDAAARELGGLLDLPRSDSGMTLVGWLNPGISDSLVADAAKRRNIDVMPLSAFAMNRRLPDGLLLGYAGVSEVELREAVIELRKAIEEVS